ncbi:MAG: hypothetical protein ACXV7D_01795 [Thermoanaerobaculia bacterium]
MPRNACIFCKRDSSEAPLIAIEYRDSTIHICAQHLPVLIHDPAQLIGILPGAERMAPSEVHD